MASSMKETVEEQNKRKKKIKTARNKYISDSLGIYKQIIRDVVYSFIFWSIFQALAPMIWFYPLNELEISGYEAFSLVWLSPVVCLIPGVFNLLQNRWVMNILRLLTVASIASFQASTTLSRLAILSMGAGASMLVLTVTLWSPDKSVRHTTYWSLMLGLHSFLSSRVWFVTFVPTWWDNTSNSAVLTFGVLSVISYMLEEPANPCNEAGIVEQNRPKVFDEHYVDGDTSSKTECVDGDTTFKTECVDGDTTFKTECVDGDKTSKQETKNHPLPSQPRNGTTKASCHPSDGKAKVVGETHWFPCGIGLGSLIYLTHMCFGEASLVSRWTVKSYPRHGPVPLLWGSLILLALACGTSLSFVRTRTLALLCVLAATAFFSGLYWIPDPYWAFLAGCGLAFLTMSLWHTMVDLVTRSNPALCLTAASLTYILQCLFWVWTVAFNFVPYGEYTREHTDWLIVIVMSGILLPVALYDYHHDSFTVHINKNDNFSRPSLAIYLKVLMVIFLAGQLGMLTRYLKYMPGPATNKSNPQVFTAGIWTFHFGYDNKGWPSMERAAFMINETGVDVLTLLESDASKPFLGNNDLATWLAERLNLYVDFGPSTKDHTWGNLLLSRYPIVRSVHHLLPSPHGELAPAITATVNISGRLVDFVVTHMGNDRDVMDRRLQAQFLSEQLRIMTNSVVFLGYVTSAPGSDNYNYLLREGQVKDIDPTDDDRWCEYIMYRKLVRLAYARLTHGGLSDTEVQLAMFRIPDNLDQFTDNNLVTTQPEKRGIDKNILFSHRFGGHYVGHGYFNGHGYHMDTPKYFYNRGAKSTNS